jgi:hypothetical protein
VVDEVVAAWGGVATQPLTIATSTTRDNRVKKVFLCFIVPLRFLPLSSFEFRLVPHGINLYCDTGKSMGANFGIKHLPLHSQRRAYKSLLPTLVQKHWGVLHDGCRQSQG